MISKILILETGKPEIKCAAIYSQPPKQALVDYIMQYLHHNYNTWEYPETITGIRESKTRKGCFSYDNGDIAIMAIPKEATT